MKNTLRICAFAFAMFAFAFTTQAQQFGYVSTQEILGELPAVKQAESDLAALQAQLEKKLQASVEQLQKDYAVLQQKVERGELSPVEQEQEVASMQQRQQDLGAEEQGMLAQIQDKRAELLEPIYTGFNDAVKEVAKEKGYTFIFDKNVLLYGEEGLDVSADIKAKLGL